MSEPNAWKVASRSLTALAAVVGDLTRNRAETVERIRRGLIGGGERWLALTILLHLETDFIADVIEPLVAVSVSHRYARLTREVLGRLPYDHAAELVAPVVLSRLDDADDDEYRRLAELLDHLGLYDALGQLCLRAAGSDDPHIKEVAVDFG
jgi:hypothetical protein